MVVREPAGKIASRFKLQRKCIDVDSSEQRVRKREENKYLSYASKNVPHLLLEKFKILERRESQEESSHRAAQHQAVVDHVLDTHDELK